MEVRPEPAAGVGSRSATSATDCVQVEDLLSHDQQLARRGLRHASCSAFGSHLYLPPSSFHISRRGRKTSSSKSFG